MLGLERFLKWKISGCRLLKNIMMKRYSAKYLMFKVLMKLEICIITTLVTEKVLQTICQVPN